MKCVVCSIDIIMVDSYGYPLYYVGGKPDRPDLAEAYLCGPECATKYFYRDKERK